tara:strand:+ start:3390 stop:3857 length:468 start_codon:yes stop_codon:yes gene_type:complete
MSEKPTGAGIVTVFNNLSSKYSDLPKDYLYLILIDNEGKFDFPKGGIDEGEFIFDCAVRETSEECNLKKEDFKKFYTVNPEEAIKCGKGLYMFLGQVENISSIKILKNPKIDIYEHSGFKFMTYNQIIESKMLYSYLLPAIKEAHIIVKQEGFIS